MQFVEKNSFNLRSAAYRLKHNESPLQFVLLPMIHVGEPKFYSEIRSLLQDCDSILYEGVKSKVSSAITVSYRLLVEKKGIGLVLQNEALKLRDLDAEFIHADMGTDEFETEWEKIPLNIRLLVRFFSPLVGLFHKFFGDKRMLAFVGNINDLPDGSGCCSGDDALSGLIITKRDRVLLDCIEKYLGKHRDEEKTVGIVYGAKHIPAVAQFLLNKHKFRVDEANWITVASFCERGRVSGFADAETNN